MHIDRHMHAVLAPESDCPVDVLEVVLVENLPVLPVAVLDPVTVVHRKTHKIEAPVADNLEVLLAELLRLTIPPHDEHLKKIEAPPAHGRASVMYLVAKLDLGDTGDSDHRHTQACKKNCVFHVTDLG